MSFQIPIVVFLFRRIDTLEQIFERIRQVEPTTVYLLSDAGRNDDECHQVDEVRNIAESLIDWDCNVIKNYATENRGVYNNIALGAKWVFEREKCAIFLEDDNLPEVSFFYYCEELLQKYENNNKILWICGTNYLENYEPKDKSSYMFTRNLLPCGWASWSNKFLKYYDFKLDTVRRSNYFKVFQTFFDKRLFVQLLNWVLCEKSKYERINRFFSWDYHMAWSLRVFGMYGISPSKNQIKNIGVDVLSEHGGTTLDQEMTRRFCGMDSISLTFPLIHPQTVSVDDTYERKIEKIILLPLNNRIRGFVSVVLHRLLGISLDLPLKKTLLERFS